MQLLLIHWSEEKSIQKYFIVKLAALFEFSKEDLIFFWLADKVYDILKDEDNALRALKIAERKLESL